MRQKIWLWLASVMLLCSFHANAQDTLQASQQLKANQSLNSANGSYRFILQGDGNVVLYTSAKKALWSSKTVGKGGSRLTMQGDGNLVLYTSSNKAVWSTKTNGKGAVRAVLQGDGNFVLYSSSGRAVWATNTATSDGGSGGSDGGGSSGGDTGGGSSSGSGIKHIGTTQIWDKDGQGIRINRPSGSQAGDLLVLVLHRTDDMLPFEVSGWKRAAECYKEDNGYDCLVVKDCTSVSGGFCTRFKNKYNGRDLAQTVFYRTVGSSEQGSYTFNLNQDSSGHPGWIILTALRGANTSNPVRDWAFKGCDGSPDSLFPSVQGEKGDMLLLSQSFDDAVSKSLFGAPSGMQTFGYVSNSDEAGFLFGSVLSASGQTGVKKTSGSGASSCKDALVSLTIKAQ